MDGDLSARGERAAPHVVVIGGGISGLAAAHHLLRVAPELRVTLIEARDRLGGKIATERVDGFVIEAGPDSFLAAKPRGLGLCQEIGLGERLQGVTPRPKRAFVLFRGRLHDLPEGLTGLVPTRLLPLARSGLLSPLGKARVALDYVTPARRARHAVPSWRATPSPRGTDARERDAGINDESLGAFIRRRLGNEAWDRLVEPLMAGIYAADGDRLSLAATFPQLREAELRHGGVIKGVLAARRAAPDQDRYGSNHRRSRGDSPSSPAPLPLRWEKGVLTSIIRFSLGRSHYRALLEPSPTAVGDSPLHGGELGGEPGRVRVERGDRSGPSWQTSPHRRSASPKERPQSAFLTPAAGLDELVAALETRLRAGGVEIRTNTAATAVLPSAHGYDVHLAGGDIISADAVILTTPAFVTAEILAAIDPALAGELAAIAHASTAIVTLAYRRDEIPHPLDGHGYVVPRGEGGPILACTWSSRKWEHRAPVGYELLRVFIGRAGQDDALAGSDDDLIALAGQEVAARLGITAPPTLTHVARWPRGMPQYLLGHPERVARIEAGLAAHPGLLLAGNAYHGVGIPDCIASGEMAADSALAFLRRGNQPAAGERVHHARTPVS